jgi:glucan phosphoethanolaminetransferase (alkaline phosphatase superfamily)
MRAVCLFGVLVLAKLLILTATHPPLSGWAPVAYFWQDVLVVLVAGALDTLVGRPRFGWALYGALVIYIAFNVPIAIVLGSPMTWPLIQAARGPLADSIVLYLTASHVARIALVVCAGVVLPLAMRSPARSTPRLTGAKWNRLAIALAAVFVAAGPMASSHVDTFGLDRNAITALVPARLPGVSAAAAVIDWRASPFPPPRIAAAAGAEDVKVRPRDSGASAATTLSRLRASANGFNVVIVVLESTAAAYLPLYGAVPASSSDPMPNLTTLSSHAILFENAYATYPESIKGLFSTLCSRYPAFGVSAEVHAEASCASFAGQLAQAGYRTALFHSGRFGYLGMDAVIARKGFDLLEDAGVIGGHIHSSFGVDEPATVDRMLGWIDSLPAAAPFLAMYLPVAGHHPYATPTLGPFREDSELARYRNALHYSDEALGALMAGLRARGLEDHTLLLIFGDHGEAFGQHPGNMGHTLFINEENVKVPYLIVVPGATTEPARVADIASLIDTAPTLLDLLGLPQPGSYQGTSLLRPGPRMALFFTDYSLGLLGLRDGCWKYIYEINAARSKLFDVCRDPNETINLSADRPEQALAYRDRVTKWSAAQKAAFSR